MDDRREEELSQPLLGEESLMIRHSSSYQSLASDDSPAHKAAHLPLFLPGRILHVTEDGPSRRSVSGPPLSSLYDKCTLNMKSVCVCPLVVFRSRMKGKFQ